MSFFENENLLKSPLILMGILTASCFIFALVYFLQFVSAQDWTQTKGVVIESSISCYSNGAKCFPKIKYEYEVNGRSFQSDNFWSDRKEDVGKSKAEEYQNLYAEKKQIIVFYDPKAPENSYLVQNDSTKPMIALFLLAGTALLVGMIVYFKKLPKV